MSNLNEPVQNQNIPPDGGGDGSKWNWSDLIFEVFKTGPKLLVESQKGTEQVTAACKKKELEQEKLNAYRQILSAQRQQLEEERRQLLEGRNIEGKTQDLSETEAVWESQARSLIKEFQDSLLTRQSIFCSSITSRNQRLELERKMLHQAATNPIAKELGIEADLTNIFKYETHCAGKLNKDKRENGRIMWGYLTYWQFQTKLKILKKGADKLGKQDN